jgi:uncharacterized damage-inducible protein DinB
MASLGDLVGHIFRVEDFFATFLSDESAPTPTAPPPNPQTPSLETLARMHQEAHEKLALYINSASEEDLGRMRMLGPAKVSNRKILAQTVLHSVHHWAQVAMEVRQAGFPPQPPQDIIVSPVME